MSELHLSLAEICWLERKLHEANEFRENKRLTTAERDAIFERLAIEIMPRLAFLDVHEVVVFLSKRAQE